MEGHELLGKIGKVRAPEGFEGRVLARIAEARRARVRRRAVYRYAFAGTAAVFLIGFAIFSLVPSGQRSLTSFAAKDRAALGAKGEAVFELGKRGPEARGSQIPVLETLDYASEVRNASYEPRTVYILEQVSEAVPSEIKF